MAAIHAKYKNRNISKKQQKKLYAKRFGNRRQEALVSAAAQRKILAERLQTNLHRESGSSESAMSSEEGGALLLRAMQLRDKLLHQFATDEQKVSFNGSSIASSTKSDNESLPGSEVSSGAILDDGTWDPIGATLNIPLREEQKTQSTKVPNLRVVVISGLFASNSFDKRSERSHLHFQKIRTDLKEPSASLPRSKTGRHSIGRDSRRKHSATNSHCPKLMFYCIAGTSVRRARGNLSARLAGDLTSSLRGRLTFPRK